MAEPKDWQELTKLTQGAPLVVERVRMAAISPSKARSSCRNWRG